MLLLHLHRAVGAQTRGDAGLCNTRAEGGFARHHGTQLVGKALGRVWGRQPHHMLEHANGIGELYQPVHAFQLGRDRR